MFQEFQFIYNNLELCGFTDKTNAFIQTIRILFENALDAIQNEKKIIKSHVKIQMIQDNPNVPLTIICTDTGLGIRSNNIFKPFNDKYKNIDDVRETAINGKFGIGLKAAMVYVHKHLPRIQTCLSITTSTEDRSSISYAEYEICSSMDDHMGAAISINQRLSSFKPSDDHKSFSGTEIKIHFPSMSVNKMEDAFGVLNSYFNHFQYMFRLPIVVDVLIKIPSVFIPEIHLDISTPQEPYMRLLKDCKRSQDDLLYICEHLPTITVEMMSLIIPFNVNKPGSFKLIVLRYANNIPMLNEAGVHSCGLLKALMVKNLWNKYGYKCKISRDYLCPILLVPLGRNSTIDGRISEGKNETLNTMIILINILGPPATLSFSNLTKTSFTNEYNDKITEMFKIVLERHKEMYPFIFKTPKENQMKEIEDHLIPLVAQSLFSISQKSSRLQKIGTIFCDVATKNINYNNTVGMPINDNEYFANVILARMLAIQNKNNLP